MAAPRDPGSTRGSTAVPRAALKSLAGGGCAELGRAEHCCGGAGAFAFVHPELSGELRKLKRDVPVAIYHLTPGERPLILPQIEALGHPRLSLLDQDTRFEF